MRFQEKGDADIFAKVREIGGMGTIDELHAVFKESGKLDTFSAQQKIEMAEKQMTRQMLRKLKLVVHFEDSVVKESLEKEGLQEGQTIVIRACHNLHDWRDGEVVRVYKLLENMTLKEIQRVAAYHAQQGRVHFMISDTLHRVVGEQLTLF